MGEITKLEFCERLEAHMGKADMAEVLADCRKAAACIREMVEQKEKLARRAERYREQVEVERKAYRNLLADHEGRTHPPAPGAEEVHSGLTASIPVEGRSYVRDELQRLMDETGSRAVAGITDHTPERTTAAIADLAARLALINAQRLDDLTATFKDTTHDR